MFSNVWICFFKIETCALKVKFRNASSCIYDHRTIFTDEMHMTIACNILCSPTSSLDYCNALLGGCSACLINKLQMVQNAAARVLTRTRKYDHIIPVLSTLHWLLIKHCIDFKILLIIYKVLNGLAQGSSNLSLEVQSAAEFSTNPYQTHLFFMF